MCDPDNIHQIANLGINWMGFIFYKKSKRFFGMENRKLKIENEISFRQNDINNFQFSTLANADLQFNFQLRKVGVFVNASQEEMMEIASQYKLDYLQLHGNESAVLCHTLQKRGFSIIKAFPIATEEDFIQTNDYEDRVDYFLFDTKCEDYGGSGKSFDWSILSSYKGKTPFILSGGINPESIDSIKKIQHPYFAGVDLNSGFEIEPGLKDVEKLGQFIKEIRAIN